MAFFKRLSRSRGNSYNNGNQDDDSYERVEQQQPQQQQQQQQGEAGPPSSYRRQGQYNPSDTPPSSRESQMYTSRPSQDSPSAYATHPQQPQRPGGGGMVGTRDSGYAGYPDGASPITPSKAAGPDFNSGISAPDLLTRAFNEAVRPYSEKIEQLEQQIADMQMYVEQMEQQRMDIFSWIDKRGLRPDVPPAIAKQMDSSPDAAASLNAQLDRKITIVNFDLHRLQDDLNDSISSAHFASSMAKFLPDIQRLTLLPGGARYAYELLIKLVGNLNSHGGLEASAGAGAGAATGPDGAPLAGHEHGANGAADAEIEEDRRARASFYERMDAELVEVVRRRNAEGEDWAVAREVKRLEKNAAYLKNLGIEPYFPRSLDVMRGHAGGHSGFGGQGGGSPPRY